MVQNGKDKTFPSSSSSSPSSLKKKVVHFPDNPSEYVGYASLINHNTGQVPKYIEGLALNDVHEWESSHVQKLKPTKLKPQPQPQQPPLPSPSSYDKNTNIYHTILTRNPGDKKHPGKQVGGFLNNPVFKKYS